MNSITSCIYCMGENLHLRRGSGVRTHQTTDDKASRPRPHRQLKSSLTREPDEPARDDQRRLPACPSLFRLASSRTCPWKMTHPGQIGTSPAPPGYSQATHEESSAAQDSHARGQSVRSNAPGRNGKRSNEGQRMTISLNLYRICLCICLNS